MKNSKYILLGIAAVVCAIVLARAYTYKYRSQDTIVVTGLGETEFSSDLIVWSGTLTAEAQNVAAGYAEIEQSKQKVQKYLEDKGIPAAAVVFEFVNVDKQYTPVYNASGNWAGQRFTGYQLRQRFTVESPDVEKVETVSREISSLIAQGVSIEAYAPDYYYTKLDDVKMGLIEKASADARMRAEKIAVNAGTKIGSVASARMGVFQITGANSNEEFASPCGSNTGYDDRSRHCEASQMPRQSGRNAVTLHITIGLPRRFNARNGGNTAKTKREQTVKSKQYNHGKTRSGAFRTQPHRAPAHRGRPHGTV